MDLLDSLTVEGVAELQTIFEVSDGLTSDAFVRVFRSLLERESRGSHNSSKSAILRWSTTALRAFFAEIDVDGNGKVDWGEFTDFVISSRRSVGRGDVSGGAVSSSSTSDVRLQLDVGPSTVSLFPRQGTHLQQLIYCRSVNKCIAASAARISVHDLSDASYPLVALLPPVGGRLLDALYLPGSSSIVASLDSGELVTFDTASNFQCISSVRTPLPIRKLCATTSSILVTGDSSGNVGFVDRGRLCSRSQGGNLRSLPKGVSYHSSAVVGLHALPLHQQRLVSVGMDCTIHLTDIETGTRILSLEGYHRKLIKATTLNEFASNLLVTVGDGSRAGCTPTEQRRQPAMYLDDSVVPHRGQLAGVDSVDGRPEVCTVDDMGMVKLWDLRVMRCIASSFIPRTVDVATSKGDEGGPAGNCSPKFVSGITCTESRAFVLAPSVCTLNRVESGVSVATHEEPIVAIAYIQVSHLIVTCTASEIAVWSTRSGVKQFTIHSQLIAERAQGGSITTISVDKTQNSRRLIVGTSNGFILSVVIAAGTVQWAHYCGGGALDSTSTPSPDPTGKGSSRLKICFAEVGAFRNIVFGTGSGCVAAIRENYLSEGVRYFYVPEIMKTTFQNLHVSRQQGHEWSSAASPLFATKAKKRGGTSPRGTTNSTHHLPPITSPRQRASVESKTTAPLLAETGFSCFAFSPICGVLLAYSLTEQALVAVDVREKRAEAICTEEDRGLGEVTAITFIMEHAPEIAPDPTTVEVHVTSAQGAPKTDGPRSMFAFGTMQGEVHLWTFISRDVTSVGTTIPWRRLLVPGRHTCSGLCAVQGRFLVASCESRETVVWDVKELDGGGESGPLTTYTVPHANGMCSALMVALGRTGVFLVASVGIDPTVALCTVDGQVAGWLCAARVEPALRPSELGAEQRWGNIDDTPPPPTTALKSKLKALALKAAGKKLGLGGEDAKADAGEAEEAPQTECNSQGVAVAETTAPTSSPRQISNKAAPGLPPYNLLAVLNERGTATSSTPTELPTIASFRRPVVEEDDVDAARRAEAARRRRKAKARRRSVKRGGRAGDFVDALLLVSDPDESEDPSLAFAMSASRRRSIFSSISVSRHTQPAPPDGICLARPHPRRRVVGGLAGRPFGESNTFYTPTIVCKDPPSPRAPM